MIFLVPCAGFGSRMNSLVPKQYLMHNEKPIIYYTLRTLYKFKIPIILVVSPDDKYINNFNLHLNFQEYLDIQYIGGTTRAQTVDNGLTYLCHKYNIDDNTWVLVHDAARPLVKFDDITNLINHCTQDNINCIGGILATPVVDTLKKATMYNSDNIITSTIDRENMYQAQTPQMFKVNLLQLALRKSNNLCSDEASAIEALGFYPSIINSSKQNIKLTQPDDLIWLQLLN